MASPTRVRVAVVIAVSIAAGCGGGDSSQSTGSSGEAAPADIKQACDLFPLETARQVLGESARRSDISAPFARASDDLAGSTCTYEADNPTAANEVGRLLTATVMVTGARTDTGTRSNQLGFEQNKTTMEQGGEKVESIEGIGEAAYYVGGVTNQLHVLVGGGRYMIIASADAPDDDRRAATERLARRVVQGL